MIMILWVISAQYRRVSLTWPVCAEINDKLSFVWPQCVWRRAVRNHPGGSRVHSGMSHHREDVCGWVQQENSTLHVHLQFIVFLPHNLSLCFSFDLSLVIAEFFHWTITCQIWNKDTTNTGTFSGSWWFLCLSCNQETVTDFWCQTTRPIRSCSTSETVCRTQWGSRGWRRGCLLSVMSSPATTT